MQDERRDPARRWRSIAGAALLAAPAAAQQVDLEAAGLLVVPAGLPDRYVVTPLVAGRVAPGLGTISFSFRIFRSGILVGASGANLVGSRPDDGPCDPAVPPCAGSCAALLGSGDLPEVVAGSCEEVGGSCWCAFPATSLAPLTVLLQPCDTVTLVLDPLGAIPELDEGNNAITVPPIDCPCDETGAVGHAPSRLAAPTERREHPRNVPVERPRAPRRTDRAPRRLVYDREHARAERASAPAKRFLGTFCYVNTDTVGFYTSTTVGTEFIDWGILGGTATTRCCGLSNIVSSLTFAYATSTDDPSLAGPGAALTLTFYADWKGFGQDSGNCPVASFAFTGLPGHTGSTSGATAYAVDVDLSGGLEFCLPDGRFGYGYRGDGSTGPLLCFTGNGAGGPEPATGNEDVFDIWVPDTKGVNVGTFFCQGGPCGFSSWYGAIARADLSATPALVATREAAPNKPGSLVCSPAALGGVLAFTLLTPGKAAAVLFAFDTQVTLPLAGGQVLLCTDLGSGELLTGGGLVATPTGNLVGGCPELVASLAVSKNLVLCGVTLTAQAVFLDPPPFALSSACDLTLGG